MPGQVNEPCQPCHARSSKRACIGVGPLHCFSTILPKKLYFGQQSSGSPQLSKLNYYGTTELLVWHYGTVIIALWYCYYGTTVPLLRHCSYQYGTTVLLRHDGTATTALRYCYYGTTVPLLWYCYYGTTVPLLRHYGTATTALLCNHRSPQEVLLLLCGSPIHWHHSVRGTIACGSRIHWHYSVCGTTACVAP